MKSYKDDLLQHYGIPGQKPGTRRFQNKDGSLTPAGKARYSSKKKAGHGILGVIDKMASVPRELNNIKTEATNKHFSGMIDESNGKVKIYKDSKGRINRMVQYGNNGGRTGLGVKYDKRGNVTGMSGSQITKEGVRSINYGKNDVAYDNRQISKIAAEALVERTKNYEASKARQSSKTQGAGFLRDPGRYSRGGTATRLKSNSFNPGKVTSAGNIQSRLDTSNTKPSAFSTGIAAGKQKLQHLIDNYKTSKKAESNIQNRKKKRTGSAG